MPLPAELAEVFELDDQGSQIFHSLTPGKQRTLLYIVAQPKRSDTRLVKALILLDYLKLSGGNLDYKELNTALKEWRDRY